MNISSSFFLRVAFLAFGLLPSLTLHAQTTGSVTGQVRDAHTKQPLAGATAFIATSNRGAATGPKGTYTIPDLPVGAYTVRFSYVGYESLTVTDVIVRPDRSTFTDAELAPAVFGADEAVVTAGSFANRRDLASIIGRDAEEIRRAPGAAGDVSRAMSSLPSVAKVNDLRNGLVVRGGSPVENAFYIDGIQIQNINHFPTQGSSGGAIGLINPDLIRDVQFQSGGFEATYGNRLSAVMDIGLRDGNRDEAEVQLDMNLGGFGFVAEGPIDSSGSSWILSARRSYLDFLVNDLMGDEADAVPTYGDIQGKTVLNLSPRSRITIFGVLGLDVSGIDQSSAIEEDENTFGDADFTMGTLGISWRYLVGNSGFITTSLSLSSNQTDIAFFETSSGNPWFASDSREDIVRFRQVTSLVSGDKAFTFGADAELELGDYRQSFSLGPDPFGQDQLDLYIDDNVRTYAGGVFGMYKVRLLPRLSVAPGIRLDYASSNDDVAVSPRLNANLTIDSRTSVALAAGAYAQRLPTGLVAQSESYDHLSNMRSRHLVASLNRLLGENTMLTVEGYFKAYSDFPIDPSQPGLFTIDELFYRNDALGMFGSHPSLLAEGVARSQGLEIMVQKKLAEKIYGLASGSYSRSRYRDLDGTWRNRATDNRVMATFEGGYKPSESWEFSLRWLFAGGTPYTPFDAVASMKAGAGIYDASQIHAKRMPDYHSLSLRFDKRFHFRSSSLITYLSIWNVYGRRNIAGYYWNEIDGHVQAVEQFGTLPIIGLEFEL